MCSTLFILGITFERFYSIVRPHKAASFNTIKRAKITIVCIVGISIAFNVPHLFGTIPVVQRCEPYRKNVVFVAGKFYYSMSFVLNFVFPFISLSIMNGVIIYTLRRRSTLRVIGAVKHGQDQDHGEGQHSKMKSTERQIYVTLLLVTF